MAIPKQRIEFIDLGDHKVLDYHEHWIQTTWRPAAAWAYLVICLFDFVIAPIMFEVSNKHRDPMEIALAVNQITDSAARVIAVQKFSELRAWKPLTLDGTGTIHIAFAAILGVAAWTRGSKENERAKNEIVASPAKKE